jgi:ornithine racemase
LHRFSKKVGNQVYPLIQINLKKIMDNAARVLELCRRAGISPCAVTKAVCGEPAVARALAEAGFSQLADSRIENVIKIREALGAGIEIMMLRLPMISQCTDVVRYCNYSLNSEVAVLSELNDRAASTGIRHNVILMVDLGDLREGIWPDQLSAVQCEIETLPHIRVAGLGTNLTCYGGVIPSPENLGCLISLKEQWEREGEPLEIVSGGNSSSLPMVLDQSIPAGINHLRLGESILLGLETVHRSPIPGAHLDSFILRAEVVELKEKPSVPIGIRTEDAFGSSPVFTGQGLHRRAVLAIGKQDIDFLITPLDNSLEILGGSSDHLLVDAARAPKLKVGDVIDFIPGYGALLAAMTSPYVRKFYLN